MYNVIYNTYVACKRLQCCFCVSVKVMSTNILFIYYVFRLPPFLRVNIYIWIKYIITKNILWQNRQCTRVLRFNHLKCGIIIYVHGCTRNNPVYFPAKTFTYVAYYVWNITVYVYIYIEVMHMHAPVGSTITQDI